MGSSVLKVLIVEDQFEYSNPLVQALESVDLFKVVGVTGSELEAYHLINEQLPDIVIVDLVIEEGDGVAFFEEIDWNAKCLPKNFYTVVVSNYLNRPDASKLKDLADVVYSKSTSPNVSSLVVNHLIAKSETIARRVARRKLNQPKHIEKPKKLKLPKPRKVKEEVANPLKEFVRYDREKVMEKVRVEIESYETSDWLSATYLKQALLLVVMQQEYKQFGPRKSNKLMEKLYVELGEFFQKDPEEIQTKVGTRAFLLRTARKIEEQLQFGKGRR